MLQEVYPARVFEMPQPELERIDAASSCDFVEKRFVGKCVFACGRASESRKAGTAFP
jgi:hypothetical protein